MTVGPERCDHGNKAFFQDRFHDFGMDRGDLADQPVDLILQAAVKQLSAHARKSCRLSAARFQKADQLGPDLPYQNSLDSFQGGGIRVAQTVYKPGRDVQCL